MGVIGSVATRTQIRRANVSARSAHFARLDQEFSRGLRTFYVLAECRVPLLPSCGKARANRRPQSLRSLIPRKRYQTLSRGARMAYLLCLCRMARPFCSSQRLQRSFCRRTFFERLVQVSDEALQAQHPGATARVPEAAPRECKV